METTDEARGGVGQKRGVGCEEEEGFDEEKREGSGSNAVLRFGPCSAEEPLKLVKPSRTYFIVGTEHKSFQSPSVTSEEKREYLAEMGTSRWAWARREFQQWMS